MKLCIGEPLSPPDWTGLPLGHFAPPGHGSALPVAAVQDTLFVWNNGASTAHVQWSAGSRHYPRHDGVLDIMAVDDEAYIEHDHPQAPGSCLLVALPFDLRETFAHRRSADLPRFRSSFGFLDTRILGLARELERHCRDGERYGRLHTDAVSDALLSQAYARYAGGALKPDRPSKTSSTRMSPHQRSKVFRYIQDNLAADIGLDQMADLLGYSRQHFARVFKGTFAMSPYQFVIDARIARAKLLLRRGRLPLAEVAGACGFVDQSHFTSCFSRRVGRSPRQYQAETG